MLGVQDHIVKITKAQARALGDFLDGVYENRVAAHKPAREFIKQIALALDKAQAADLENVESNLVVIEVVETL